jgi:peptidoglycan/xylan/chitin deacetylase (PgdA/CDA1 family)
MASAALFLVACQSVHTQPQTSAEAAKSTPVPLGSPVSLTLDPSARAATPSPSPSATAKPVHRSSYVSVHGVGRTVALTFDDGPSAKLTPQLLDMLKARGIHATFFVVGQNAAEYPDILKRAVAEGHEIGNHSWSHPQLTRLSAAGFTAQIEKTNAAIRAAIGHDPVLIRPPYGATNAKLNHLFEDKYGMKVILWSVDPLDWKYRNSAHVEREILAQTTPGAIILSHDIHATTVAAMPATLDALLAKGYKFVTVSELIAMEGSVPSANEKSAGAAITPPPAPTPYGDAAAEPSSSPVPGSTPSTPVAPEPSAAPAMSGNAAQ